MSDRAPREQLAKDLVELQMAVTEAVRLVETGDPAVLLRVIDLLQPTEGIAAHARMAAENAWDAAGRPCDHAGSTSSIHCTDCGRDLH